MTIVTLFTSDLFYFFISRCCRHDTVSALRYLENISLFSLPSSSNSIDERYNLLRDRIRFDLLSFKAFEFSTVKQWKKSITYGEKALSLFKLQFKDLNGPIVLLKLLADGYAETVKIIFIDIKVNIS